MGRYAQALEVRGLSPKETWNPMLASSSCLSRVLKHFTGLRRLALLSGCNLHVSTKHVLQLENMPELEDLQVGACIHPLDFICVLATSVEISQIP